MIRLFVLNEVLSFENFFIWIIHRTFIWPLATTSFDEDCFKNNFEQVLFRQSAESRDCFKNNLKIHSWNFQHFVTYHKVLCNSIVPSFNSLWTSCILPNYRVLIILKICTFSTNLLFKAILNEILFLNVHENSFQIALQLRNSIILYYLNILLGITMFPLIIFICL